MSALRVDWFSLTVTWLTASQSLLAGFSKSTTFAGSPLVVPSGLLTGTVTPRVRTWWKDRFRVSSVGPSGLIRFLSPVSSADAGRPGLRLTRVFRSRSSSTTWVKSVRSAPGVSVVMPGP